MDTVRLVVAGAMPKSIGGKIAVFGAVGLGVLLLDYYPAKWFWWRYEGKYRESVCWEQYKAQEQAFLQPEIVSRKEYFRRYIVYKECIRSARKGKEIPKIN
jgi:hypothetical protein